MITSRIADGEGRGHYAKVTEENVLEVINHNHPPKSETLLAIPYRQRLTNSAGATAMNVDGSTVAVDFKVSANNARDIYVRSLSILVGDGGTPALNEFGDLSALTNGVEVSYVTQDEGTFIIHDGIKTNLELIRLGVDSPAVGTGTDAFLLDVTGGGSEKSYLSTVDIKETFGMPFGLKLRQSTTDYVTFTVRDDLTALTTFNIIAYGIQL